MGIGAAALLEPSSASAAQAALSRHAELLRGFHSTSCPDGHAPSRAAEWLDDVLRYSPEQVAAVDVEYARGYEPYGLVEAKRLKAPGCAPDERFIGWHRDRVEWFLRLASRRAVLGFSVLRSPVGFVLDWQPHAPTAQRAASCVDPLYLAAMEGLYQRALRALRASAEDHTYQQAATEEAGAGSAAVQLHERGELAIGGACGDVASEGAALAMLLEREGDAVAEWSRSFGGDAAEMGEMQRRSFGGDAAEGDVDADEPRSTILETVSAEKLREIASGCSVRRSVWDADAKWRVDGCRRSLANVSREGTGRTSTARVSLHAGIGPPSHASKRGAYPSGVAIKAGPTSRDGAAAGLAVAFEVCFDEGFEWGGGGGVLPGVYCEPAGPSGVGLDCRFKWDQSGGLRFKAELVSTTRRWPLRLAIHLERRSHQLLRRVWHRLSVAVCPRDGTIGAWADDVCLHRSGGPNSVRFGGGVAGLRLCVFRRCPCDEATHATVTLRSLRLHCASGSKACVLAAARVSDSAATPVDDVDHLIATELTIIFAPKEWQSTGPAALRELVWTSPRPRRLIVAIAPPLSEATATALRAIAAVAWRLTPTDVRVVDEPRRFRNAYELRNELAAIYASDTKYVLHLNNDVVACAPPPAARYHWLRELVRSAEHSPEAWATQPILIERTPHAPMHLHAWWASVTRSNQTTASEADAVISGRQDVEPAAPHQRSSAVILAQCQTTADDEADGKKATQSVLYARFDAMACSLPISAIPEHLSGRSPAFLEDHCILARTAHFPPCTPLFEPESCFRREYFALAWNIRRRGGDVGLAAASVVIYDRLEYVPPSSGLGDDVAAPHARDGARSVVPCDDLFGFVGRRHDEISHRSIRHLNATWACAYATDTWHEAQRDHTLGGLQLSAADQAALLNEPVARARLLLCTLLLMGYDRFAWQAGDAHTWSRRGGAQGGRFPPTDSVPTSAPLNALEALRAMPEEASGRACCVVCFWRASEQALDMALDAAAGVQSGALATIGAVPSTDPLEGLVPWVAPSWAPTAPATAQDDADRGTGTQGSDHELICVGELPPWAVTRCRPIAVMAGTDCVWLWIRWPRVANSGTAESTRARAQHAARRLASSMGGLRAEAATGAVSNLDLGCDIDYWSYRPLTLEELEADAEQAERWQRHLSQPAQLEPFLNDDTGTPNKRAAHSAPRSRWLWSARMVRVFRRAVRDPDLDIR